MSNVIPFRKAPRRSRLVIVGNGMATAKLLDELVQRDDLDRFEVTVIGDEPTPAYNRILLNRVLLGTAAETIVLKDAAWLAAHRVALRSATRALRLDLTMREVVCSAGPSVPFDEVVLATGSRATVPEIVGLRDDDTLKRGAFVYRTVEDARAIREAVTPGAQAVVLGGGLLALEVAAGLTELGVRVTVVHRAAGLMERQLDAMGGAALAAHMQGLGVACLGGRQARAILGDDRVSGVELDDGTQLPCSLLLLACGVQPRVEVARASGIPVRRAIPVDDELGVPGVSGVYAVGECAEHRGHVYGIVAPIYAQVRVLANVLTGRPTPGFTGAKLYTRLKVAGVDVASMGATEAALDDEVVVVSEPRRHVYRKLIVRAGRLIGAQLVGDTEAAARIVQLWDREDPLPPNRLDVLCSEDVLRSAAGGNADREVCNCHRVCASTIESAVDAGCTTVEQIAARTAAGTGCGSCRGELARLARERRRTAREVVAS